VDAARVIIAIGLGGFGLYHLVRDFRRVWANRGARDTLSKLERFRLFAICLAVGAVLPVLPAVALDAGRIVVACMAVAALGFAAFLILSVVVGFLEGTRGEEGSGR
jgi:hypothetical protein